MEVLINNPFAELSTVSNAKIILNETKNILESILLYGKYKTLCDIPNVSEVMSEARFLPLF